MRQQSRGLFRRSRGSLTSARTRRGFVLSAEQLDDRVLLSVSVSDTLVFTPDAGSATPGGYTPAQIANAYGLNDVSLNGAGETIAIVDAYDDPDLVDSTAPNFDSSELHQFDVEFGLPDPPSFTKVGQTGGAPPTATDSSGEWEGEEALDVEWAHATAPGANIILVEADSSSNEGLFGAAQWAGSVSGASVVSMSWGAYQLPGDSEYDSDFLDAGVTFVASSGDDGYLIYPAASPDVLGVGGTSLVLNSSGGYGSETTWNYTDSNGTYSSGGGQGAESKPAYQDGFAGGSYRTGPDVSFNSGPSGTPTTGYSGNGYSVYDSYNNGSSDPWVTLAGTSAGAPQWAGLVAMANQQLASAGLAPLTGYNGTLPLIYQMSSSDFNDITSGSNQYGLSAGPGYDEVTGRGTPIANELLGSLPTALSAQTEYAVGANGQIDVTTWDPTSESWSTGTVGSAGTFAPETPLTVDIAGDNIHLFAIGANGYFTSAYWTSTAGWTVTQLNSTTQFATAAQLSLLVQGGNTYLYGVDANGYLAGVEWSSTTGDWTATQLNGTTQFGAAASLSLLAEGGDTFLYGVGPNGYLIGAQWSSTTGDWTVTQLNDTTQFGAAAPLSLLTGGGNTYLYGVGPNGYLIGAEWSLATGDWTVTQLNDTTQFAAAAPLSLLYQGGSTYLYGIGEDGYLTAALWTPSAGWSVTQLNSSIAFAAGAPLTLDLQGSETDLYGVDSAGSLVDAIWTSGGGWNIFVLKSSTTFGSKTPIAL
jgi:subtilase family serine protease